MRASSSLRVTAAGDSCRSIIENHSVDSGSGAPTDQVKLEAEKRPQNVRLPRSRLWPDDGPGHQQSDMIVAMHL